jgi:hypothetical protein
MVAWCVDSHGSSQAITKKMVSLPQDLGYPGNVIQDRLSAIKGKVMQENIILLQRRIAWSGIWYPARPLRTDSGTDIR